MALKKPAAEEKCEKINNKKLSKMHETGYYYSS